ncbi:hypothetical protein L1987_68489 [Smallanthus sonchifolius]|uniref:Uncharacterized protein n=1 Tax=Smallanthus sonchifolius TaxID=185202 RepID=A0ACB9B5A4_9ASTR|nr:hypothetical protein L1987_68489 [Smallanthus sonchifolius]
MLWNKKLVTCMSTRVVLWGKVTCMSTRVVLWKIGFVGLESHEMGANKEKPMGIRALKSSVNKKIRAGPNPVSSPCLGVVEGFEEIQFWERCYRDRG